MARPERYARVVPSALLAALITAAVVVPLSAARPEVPAPAPASLAPPTARTLSEAYAANRANAARAARMAAAHGDHRRAAADRATAAPTRRFLAFDGRGPGRATEVFGDLAHADRAAWRGVTATATRACTALQRGSRGRLDTARRRLGMGYETDLGERLPSV